MAWRAWGPSRRGRVPGAPPRVPTDPSTDPRAGRRRRRRRLATRRRTSLVVCRGARMSDGRMLFVARPGACCALMFSSRDTHGVRLRGASSRRGVGSRRRASVLAARAGRTSPRRTAAAAPCLRTQTPSTVRGAGGKRRTSSLCGAPGVPRRAASAARGSRRRPVCRATQRQLRCVEFRCQQDYRGRRASPRVLRATERADECGSALELAPELLGEKTTPPPTGLPRRVPLLSSRPRTPGAG